MYTLHSHIHAHIQVHIHVQPQTVSACATTAVAMTVTVTHIASSGQKLPWRRRILAPEGVLAPQLLVISPAIHGGAPVPHARWPSVPRPLLMVITCFPKTLVFLSVMCARRAGHLPGHHAGVA